MPHVREKPPKTLFGSHEKYLLPFIEDVCVDSTWFADHSIVYAKLASLPKPEPVPLWCQPKAFPWAKISTQVDSQIENCIQAVMQTFEDAADQSLRKIWERGPPTISKREMYHPWAALGSPSYRPSQIQQIRNLVS